MIYQHQQKAIDYITNKMNQDPQVKALLISGSIAHGFNAEDSDIDINIIVSNECYEEKKLKNNLTYYEDGKEFYEGGYFDGKFITLDYLTMIANKGSEPSKFALHDSIIAFDKTGQVAQQIKEINTYDTIDTKENVLRFLSQLDGWNWYCGEAIHKGNTYLLDLSVNKLILFAGRLLLLENKLFFPFHKWFIKVLESAKNKPEGFMECIQTTLRDKSKENINNLYHMVKDYKDWTGGDKYSWTSYFVHDVETIWLRAEEFIDHI